MAKTNHILNINDLEKKSKGPVWAINSTANNERSRIIITVAKMHGSGYDTVIVHNTFIPVNLTEQVNKEQLLRSSDFRKAVSRGYISIVTAEYADQVLSTPSGRAELSRLQKELNMTMRERQNQGLSSQEPETSGLGLKAIDNSHTANNTATVIADDIKPSVVQIMASAKGKPELEVYNSLKNTGGMGTSDWEYVLREARALGMKKLASKAASRVEDSGDED